MKRQSIKLLFLGIIMVGVMLLTAFGAPRQFHLALPATSDDLLKHNVIKILDTKCNSCHRKQNPFMIFTSKNMDKRINKIYEQVFVKKRMPKGDDQLSTEESDLLKKWIKSNLK